MAYLYFGEVRLGISSLYYDRRGIYIGAAASLRGSTFSIDRSLCVGTTNDLHI